MGQSISASRFSSEDVRRFEQRLADQLESLRSVLSDPGFGKGPSTLGAELELCLLDAHCRPLMRNLDVCHAMAQSGVTPEINRYNLELNLDPTGIAGNPFSILEQQIRNLLAQVDSNLEQGGSAVAIGILPTLTERDFGPQCMTEEPRYDALSQMLRYQRGEQFQINIQGQDHLHLSSEDVTLEGANTSTQIHVRVDPDQFGSWFNAFQLITPVALALSANSPLFLGRRLWHETRVPLFRQSIDGRSQVECERSVPSRVDFGSGWVRSGAYELFAEQVNLYPPLLPLCQEENEQQGTAPELHELRLHSGTVWPWNRAVYDPASGGHLRIELRALPAGPSSPDICANAAFMIGVAARLRADIEAWIHRMPFETLASNFYAAAKHGMDSEHYWPLNRIGLSPISTPDLAARLLDLAGEGLKELGVSSGDIDRYLGIIEERIASRQNGALWLLDADERLRKRSNLTGSERMQTLMRAYSAQSRAEVPVAHWQLTGL